MAAVLSNPSLTINLSTSEPFSAGAASGQLQINHNVAVNYALGTAVSQCDTVYTNSGNITAAASPVSIQVSAAGSLLDPAGNAAAFVHIAAIAFTNLDAVKSISVGAGSNTLAFLATAAICEPGCTILLGGDPTSSLVVTASTGDIITLTSSSGATNTHYKITILGRSA